MAAPVAGLISVTRSEQLSRTTNSVCRPTWYAMPDTSRRSSGTAPPAATAHPNARRLRRAARRRPPHRAAAPPRQRPSQRFVGYVRIEPVDVRAGVRHHRHAETHRQAMVLAKAAAQEIHLVRIVHL